MAAIQQRALLIVLKLSDPFVSGSIDPETKMAAKQNGKSWRMHVMLQWFEIKTLNKLLKLYFIHISRFVIVRKNSFSVYLVR